MSEDHVSVGRTDGGNLLALRRSHNVFADAMVSSALWCEVSTTVVWMLTVLVNPVGLCRRTTSILVNPTEVIYRLSAEATV